MGSSDTNDRDEQLSKCILESNLSIFNVENSPTFITRAKHEVLDITIRSVNLSYNVEKWWVTRWNGVLREI